MIHFTYPIIIEFFIGLFLWWIAVYLISQNPFSRLIQVLFGIFAAISIYLTSDLFFYASVSIGQFSLEGTLMKTFIWSLYLPAPLLYHASYLLTKQEKRQKWQRILLYLVYLITAFIVFVEVWTNLTRNYNLIFSLNFTGNLVQATGRNFWLIGIFFMFIFIVITINFYLLLKEEAKFSKTWYKFFWPFLGMLFTLILGPLVLLSYYNIIPHPFFFGSIVMIVLALPLAYSILKYDLLIEEAKIIFGKTFLYSTIVIVSILALYLVILFSMGIEFPTIKSLIIPYALSYLIILTHPAYDWFSTFVRDLVYNISSGISVVNDNEVYNALKNYNNQEVLENSSLLRLDVVSREVRSGAAETPVDALRKIIQNSIEYFEPQSNVNRRTKQNLKHHLLKMLVFDQAEEGQMLWELGFEEYPMRILGRESQGRPPLFKSSSASDYSYISRNAFIALKKEAIHDVAWRISYLEKLAKKKKV